MAEDTKYVDAEPVSIYFYVDKKTGLVDAILTFNLIGMAIRRYNTWDTITRKDSEFDKYVNGDWDLWKFDWDKDEDVPEGADPAGERAWDPELIKNWDDGVEIDTKMLGEYAYKIDNTIEEDDQEN